VKSKFIAKVEVSYMFFPYVSMYVPSYLLRKDGWQYENLNVSAYKFLIRTSERVMLDSTLLGRAKTR